MKLLKHAVSTATLLLFTLILFAQKSPITGKVTDAFTGSTVGGATIKVKSTGITTVTKSDGTFSAEADSNDVLEVSSLSYAPQNVTIDGKTEININLTSTIQDLGQ